MKIVSRKNFWCKDRVKEKMMVRKSGEVFDFPVKEEADRQDLFGMIDGQLIDVIDTDYIPKSGRYIGIYEHSMQRPDGGKLKIMPGQPITLNQVEASRLMSLSIVRPEKSKQWRPSYLITGSVSSEPPKPMFDMEVRENWVQRDHRIKGGHE